MLVRRLVVPMNEAVFASAVLWVHIHEARIGKQRMQVEEEDEEEE